jgi:putative addiction module component (TIGR02574 family)
MPRTLTKDEIAELSVPERMRLIETVWDSIDPNDLPLPEGHRLALDDSLADYDRGGDEGQSWDEVRDELFPKR